MKGNHAKAVLVSVFGNRAYNDTLLELKDIAEESGFVCIAAIAELSIMHQFGSGRPGKQDKEDKYGVRCRLPAKCKKIKFYSFNSCYQ